MSGQKILIGCGALLALSVVIILAILVGSVIGGGGSSSQSPPASDTKQDESEKKSTSKKKTGPQNVEVAVSESAELNDRALIVNEVDRNYMPPSRVPGLQAGEQPIRVYITLTNTSNQSFSYNPNNFKVQDSSGVQQTPESPMQLPFRIEHGSLASGGTLEGNMAFNVPQGDTGLRLVYEPFERGLGTVTVTL